MSPPISDLPPLQNSAVASKANAKTDAPNIKNERTDARSTLNARIIESALKVSINAGSDPQALLFRSVLDRVKEAIGSISGSKPSETLPTQPSVEDNSPEAYAEKILSFSLGFFDAYAAQHPGKDQTQLANDFVDLVRGGFEKGFNEAVDILKALNVFNGGVEEGIQKTYELVMKGYEDFIASKLQTSKAEG